MEATIHKFFKHLEQSKNCDENFAMNLVRLKPITNGTRHQVNIEKSLLSKNNNIVKNLRYRINSAHGRSPQTGHITAWHRGGGHKKLYRLLENPNRSNVSVVVTTSYDPYRTSFISLNFDLLKKKFFQTITTDLIYPGAIIGCRPESPEYRLGFRTQVKNIPAGSFIHNISISKKKMPEYARAAGTTAQIIQNNDESIKIKLPSHQVVEIPKTSYATIGSVSNSLNNMTKLGKAGRNRNKGRRPHVRGIAMNPVDHPHGGKANGGVPSKTPWGLPTKCGFRLKRRSKRFRRTILS
jgi:large subunit ribosomal protein L2